MFTNRNSSLALTLKRTLTTGLCASAIITYTSGAHAAVLFSEDFDSNTTGLNAAPAGWTVSNGTVDIIGNGFFDFYSGNGAYIDLDGSTSDAGELSRSFSLLGGVTYNASFTLGGSTRGDSNTVDVSFGNVNSSFTLASNDPLALFTVGFTPASDGSYALTFANQGGDNLGAILLDVQIANVIPEPETYGLMLTGLGMLALAKRRRRKAVNE